MKLNEAEEKFKNFIAKYKDSTLIPNAHFWYGEIFFQRKDYNKAAVQYLKSYKISKEKNITKNSKSADALLKLAVSLSELRKNKDACGILDKLTQEFPKRTEEIIKKEREIRIKLGCK
jgi:tol-pal system protein YbgF